MIKKIRIRKCATYNDEGCEIDNLDKINFIYGANGTGKTTISNFLKDVTETKYSHCQINWQNSEIDTLVYNKVFREENFNTGKINGIFTLGKATKEEIERIDQKTIERTKIIDEGKQRKETLEKQREKAKSLEVTFRESLWVKLFKKNEKNFREALRGAIGSKEAFKNKILSEFSMITKTVKTIDEILEKTETIFAENLPIRVDEIVEITNNILSNIESNLVWDKVVVGKADVEISKLIHKLNIDDWVNKGRTFIQDNICPFCQEKTISENLIKQLESYFDESYLKELKNIKDFKETYFSHSQNIINLLEQIEVNQKSISNSKLNNELFRSYVKTLSQQIKNNQIKVENKLKEPSRKIELEQTTQQIEKINELILNANKEIKKHNDVVKNFQTEKEKLIKEVWEYLTEDYRTEIEKFIKEIEGLTKGIDSLEKQVQEKREKFLEIDSEIKELSRNLTDIQPTVDEINRLLQYYGFLNFQIVKSTQEGFYQIQRQDGSFAHDTLSEGEVTFITFLYFLQLAKGSIEKENIANDRILVIDDPISSLDSNILFIVSTLVKNIINEVKENKGSIKQLIILTHNVYFHKEVSFIDSRQRESKEAHYWILRKNGIVSKIQAYGIKNPIQSSYSLLWEEYKNDTITSSISIQNIMRRIIENYFKLLGKYGDDKLINKFDNNEEREICKSLISWINDGSHSIHDDLFIEIPTQTTEIYRKVFKDIFEKSKHIAHYNMMMGIEEE
ncbi:AAA family ATPase [Empedobacter brevis]|uniref:AAA family ATPase n=1 Tax=Empedobacter brevis TaxID=247 RepID=UPI00333F68DE